MNKQNPAFIYDRVLAKYYQQIAGEISSARLNSGTCTEIGKILDESLKLKSPMREHHFVTEICNIAKMARLAA